MRTFTKIHRNFRFTLERAENERTTYLTSCMPGWLRVVVLAKSVFRSGPHTCFSMAVWPKFKQIPMHCLTNRVRKICTEATVGAALRFLLDAFQSNVYPERLLEETMLHPKERHKWATVENKSCVSVCSLKVFFHRMSSFTNCPELSRRRSTQQKRKSCYH